MRWRGVLLDGPAQVGLGVDTEGFLDGALDPGEELAGKLAFRVGVNLDTGNFHTEDIYGDLAKVAPYSLNVQVKVVVSGPDKKKQPSNFKRLAKILRDASYRGYIVLEYEESGDPREECPKYIDELREAFG